MGNNKDKHLTYFKVEGFKNFKSLELEDVGFFNLVTGDNNVGKTNLLEALNFEENNYTKFLYILGCLTNWRFKETPDYIIKPDFIRNYFNSNSVEKTIEFNFSFQNAKKEIIKIQNINKDSLTKAEIEEIQNLNLNLINTNTFDNCLRFSSMDKVKVMTSNFSQHKDFETRNGYIPFICSNHSHGADLAKFYSELISVNKQLRAKLLHYLKIFFNNIDSIDIGKSNIKDEIEILIGFENINTPQPLSMFGDGFTKYFRILLEILVAKSNRLMIDEIDNGIHYSRRTEFIKKIILAAIESNTQIFCSTHSKECLTALKIAFESEELKKHQNEFRCYSLAKNNQEDIKAFKYNYEEFQSNINSNNELR